jgi:uncharacterized protein with HEPN domain
VKRDRLFLTDIAKACDKVATYIAEGKASFFASEMAQDAVIRNLEIIGEASKNLTIETKAKASEQPWRQITGMRDKLIHQYFGVNLDRVWETASVIVPPFRIVIIALLKDLTDDEEGAKV